MADSRKFHRNDPCPCGAKVNKIFTDEDDKEVTIPVPVKYKHCCWHKNATGKDWPAHVYTLRKKSA